VEVPDLAAELGVGLAAADGGLALVTATDGNHGRDASVVLTDPERRIAEYRR
jgi:hypothetical protein